MVSTIDQGWYWYFKGGAYNDDSNEGKFMTFHKGDIPISLQETILEAVETNVTTLVKHTNPDTMAENPNSRDGSWVVIWYSSDKREKLQRLASFLVEKNLVPRTKAGKLYNISFKYDFQTRSREYGDKFKSIIKLEDLLDLDTGQIL